METSKKFEIIGRNTKKFDLNRLTEVGRLRGGLQIIVDQVA